MGMNAQQRAALIDDLIANSSVWDESDRETLEGFGDSKLKSLSEHNDEVQRAFAVANAAAAGIDTGTGLQLRIDPETGQWQRRRVNNTMDPAAMMKKKKMASETEEEYDEMVEDEEEMETNSRRPARNRRMTSEELMRRLPPEMQQTLENARQIENQEKNKVIEQILVNVSSPADRQVQFDRLIQLTLNDLYSTLALIPKSTSIAEEEETRPAPRRRVVANHSPDEEDVLPLPTMNWENAEGKGKTAETSSVQYEEHVSEDDWLNSAPPSVRNRFMNALAIEDRERQKYIDILTANVVDEDAERKLVGVLKHKPLEELKLLAKLTPPKEAPRPTYFGANVPLANGRSTNNATGDDPDDILVVPKMDWGAK